MKIYNTQVYGIAETIIRSGYPMSKEPVSEFDFSEGVYLINEQIKNGLIYEVPVFKRLASLAKCEPNSGHDCALKGIRVQTDILATGYWWQQFQRYHHADIISSQSKVHRILYFDVDNIVTSNVKPQAIQALKDAITEYKDNNSLGLEYVLDNVPGGLLLSAGVDLNYLQLKTMHKQRKHHKLSMWNSVFDLWVRSLPFADKLIIV